jgi:hypothetical protein
MLLLINITWEKNNFLVNELQIFSMLIFYFSISSLPSTAWLKNQAKKFPKKNL